MKWAVPIALALALLGLDLRPGSLAGDSPLGTFDPVPEPAIAWNPKTYVAYRAEAPPRIDGRTDEPAWAAAAWTDDFVDIQGPARPAPRFRTRAKMLWDATAFYVAAELEEPDVWGSITQRDAVVFHDDDFEVFIDPDGDTHQYCELEINALGTVWDLFLVKPYRDGGQALDAWDIRGLQSAVSVDGTRDRPGDLDRGWSVEIALPWDAFQGATPHGAPPDPGAQWRVNFSRVEWRTIARDGRYVKALDPAGKPLPEDNWVWSPQGIVNMHYPEMWGFVQFSARKVGQDLTRFEPRAVEAAKWSLRAVYYAERAWFLAQGAYTGDLALLRLQSPPLPGAPWPPRIAVTPCGYEASIPVPGDRRVCITPDGAIR